MTIGALFASPLWLISGALIVAVAIGEVTLRRIVGEQALVPYVSELWNAVRPTLAQRSTYLNFGTIFTAVVLLLAFALLMSIPTT